MAMKIVAIHGSQRKQCTYHTAWEVIQRLVDVEHAEVTEFFMPKDMPHFCNGCFTCIAKGMEFCPHAAEVQPIRKAIDEADVVVLTSATYVYDVTGQMKAFLDHLAYRWMVHRPSPAMFHKVGLVVSTSAGAGHGSALKTMKSSLEFWGTARTYKLGLSVQAAAWDGISAKKKAQISKKADRIVSTIRRETAKGNQLRPSWKVRGMFLGMGKLIQMLSKKTGGADDQYWKEQGWQDGKRPWKD